METDANAPLQQEEIDELLKLNQSDPVDISYKNLHEINSNTLTNMAWSGVIRDGGSLIVSWETTDDGYFEVILRVDRSLLGTGVIPDFPYKELYISMGDDEDQKYQIYKGSQDEELLVHILSGWLNKRVPAELKTKIRNIPPNKIEIGSDYDHYKNLIVFLEAIADRKI